MPSLRVAAKHRVEEAKVKPSGSSALFLLICTVSVGWTAGDVAKIHFLAGVAWIAVFLFSSLAVFREDTPKEDP